MFRGTRRPGQLDPAHHRQLRGNGAHPAADPEDQQARAGFEVQRFERVVRRTGRDRKHTGVGERQAGGHPGRAVGGDERDLGVPAASTHRRPADPVTRLETGSGPEHGSGHFATEDGGQLEREEGTVHALADLPVHRVHASRVHLDENLIGAGFGHPEGEEALEVGTAVVSESVGERHGTRR
jgi:hypothetical protein